jgi:acetyl-CoA decarbonylase/synthase complex subunit epsilon
LTSPRIIRLNVYGTFFIPNSSDPEWKGLDGMGQYDLAMIVGVPYYMEWLILSALKHSAPDVKTISLDRFYQPKNLRQTRSLQRIYALS